VGRDAEADATTKPPPRPGLISAQATRRSAMRARSLAASGSKPARHSATNGRGHGRGRFGVLRPSRFRAPAPARLRGRDARVRRAPARGRFIRARAPGGSRRSRGARRGGAVRVRGLRRRRLRRLVGDCARRRLRARRRAFSRDSRGGGTRGSRGGRTRGGAARAARSRRGSAAGRRASPRAGRSPRTGFSPRSRECERSMPSGVEIGIVFLSRRSISVQVLHLGRIDERESPRRSRQPRPVRPMRWM
jgi:hypothetical protein